MNIKRFEKLQREVHEVNVKNGWWETPPSIGDILAMMHCELSEAMEAYREGKNIDDVWYDCKQQDDECTEGYYTSIGGCQSCPYSKPEGIPVELADCVMRIMDIMEYVGFFISKELYDHLGENIIAAFKKGIMNCGFGSVITIFHSRLPQMHRDSTNSLKVLVKHNSVNFTLLIVLIDYFLQRNNLDLLDIIERKNEYNKTRGYKHGGKRV